MFTEILHESEVKLEGKRRSIWAHSGKKPELMHEHVKKVRFVFEYFLIEDGLLTNFYNSINEIYNLDFDFEEFKQTVLELANFHDIGKTNPKFQKEKLRNDDFEDIELPTEIHVTSEHSLISALLFAIYLSKEKNLKDNPVLLVLPPLIHGHHTRLRSLFEQNADYGIASVLEDQKYDHLGSTISYLFELLPLGKNEFEKHFQRIMNMYSNIGDYLNESSSNLSFFYNYIYSVLIKADSVATSYSEKGLENLKNEIEKYYRRIDDELLEKMYESFQKKQQHYLDKEEETPLNSLRTEMYQEAMKSLKKGLNEGKSVYYLQMPTGGGKTHTSLGLALKILKETSADRLIYSLPYISLLEQNYDYFQEVLDLPHERLRPIYSFSDIPEDGEEIILTYDDLFEYPTICTTMVSLLESIVKFDKSSKYRFESWANSVIILDEIQTLPVEYWPEFNYLLNEVAEKLNAYIIIMSATVPNLEELKTSRLMDSTYEKKCNYLIDDPERYYEKFKRNEIISSGIESIEISDFNQVEELVNDVFNKCNNQFKKNHNHGLVVVNTVRTSKKLFENLERKFSKEDTKVRFLLLNSTILPSEKRKRIDIINEMDRDEKVLLVSTQSVEAGLDVSFDFVIRDFSPLESIEQVRGRCNRNREIDQGDVYLYEITSDKSEASKIYQNWRLEKSEQILDKTDYSYGFSDIEEYFEDIINEINEQVSEEMKLTASENIECWNKLKLEENNSPKNKHKKVFHVDIIEENKRDYSFFVATTLDKRIFEDCLFSLKSKYQSYLTDRQESYEKVEKGIRKCFIEEGYPLSSKAKINKVNDRRWMIEDEDNKSDINKFFIEGQDEILNIYIENTCLEFMKTDLGMDVKDGVDGSELIKLYQEEMEKKRKGYLEKRILREQFSSVLSNFTISGVLNVDERELESILEKIGPYYVIPDHLIGDKDHHLYSLEEGLNKDYFNDEDNNII